MSDSISPVSGQSRPGSAGNPLQGQSGVGTAPETRGRTTIADSVVEKIAGMATREVPGIHSLGAGMTRTLGAVRDKVPGGRSSMSRGVKVEVGERQTAVDLDVVVEYGVSIVDVAGDVRTNVITAVERMTGLEVVEVNIAVDDVHLPDEEEEGEEGEGRVQ
ncbi:Asp23/Gls24 family envelope stress response protein [Streptomyces sp. NPDC044571]|uniref:Asp23/Gls24 family envelope stress response protein n=1 Tax=Streptomyces sp. NPDC044571 TaxID=3155371 RepID=UPI0033F5FED0